MLFGIATLLFLAAAWGSVERSKKIRAATAARSAERQRVAETRLADLQIRLREAEAEEAHAVEEERKAIERAKRGEPV